MLEAVPRETSHVYIYAHLHISLLYNSRLLSLSLMPYVAYTGTDAAANRDLDSTLQTPKALILEPK